MSTTSALAFLQIPGTSFAPSAEHPAWGQNAPASVAGADPGHRRAGPMQPWPAPPGSEMDILRPFPLSHVIGPLLSINLGPHREEACPWLPRWPGCQLSEMETGAADCPPLSHTHVQTQQTPRVPSRISASFFAQRCVYCNCCFPVTSARSVRVHVRQHSGTTWVCGPMRSLPLYFE